MDLIFNLWMHAKCSFLFFPSLFCFRQLCLCIWKGTFGFNSTIHIVLHFWRGISLIIFSHRESWYISARLERFYSIIFLGVLLLPGF